MTEDMLRAARTISSAADAMKQTACNIDASLDRHATRMDDWLQRFEHALAADRQPIEIVQQAAPDYNLDVEPRTPGMIEQQRTTYDALLAAAKASAEAIGELFVGTPLTINGKPIDHTKLNNAGLLAERAVRLCKERAPPPDAEIAAYDTLRSLVRELLRRGLGPSALDKLREINHWLNGNRVFDKRLTPASGLLRLLDELSASVDAAANDIGGHRSAHAIMVDLAKAVG